VQGIKVRVMTEGPGHLSAGAFALPTHAPASSGTASGSAPEQRHGP
jgi:hypothetical protein